MRKLFGTALLVGACFCTQQVGADPILVRSGEHAEFTRLVLLLPEGATWGLEQNTQTAWIELEGFDEGFDLSEAFEIIPRTRLNALVATDNRLELQMNCNCQVSGFLERNGYLVVDIADGSDIEEEEPATAINQLDLPQTEFQFGDLLWANGREDGSHTNSQEQEDFPDAETPRKTPVLPDQLHIERSRQNILEAFSSAASKGLVQMPDRAEESVTSTTDTVQNPGIFDSSSSLTEEVGSEFDQIRVTNSNDVPADNPGSQVALSGATCPDPDMLKISSWGNAGSFDEQISESNRQLFDETGRLNQAEALSRAKLYLFFGFGAEAQQILDMIPDVSAEHPELFDLAQYFEHGFVKNPRLLHRFPDCDSAFALWGMLAPQDFPPSSPANVDAALLALEFLPDHVKYHVGQDLGDTLLQLGKLEQASVAMRAYERLPDHPKGHVTLNDAKAQSLRNDLNSSAEVLTEVLSDDTDESPLALVKLIDQRLAENASVPDDLLKLAEAYSFELQNTDIASPVLRAYILAAAQSSLFERAIVELKNGWDAFDEVQKGEVASKLFLKIAESANDSEFLERYFLDADHFSSVLSADSILALSERLLDLGFAKEAEIMLQNLDADPNSDREKLLVAKLHLIGGSFAQSLEQLRGLQSQEANSLRAKALQGLGENAEASALFKEADQPDLATAATWLSNEWTELVNSEDPVFGPVRDIAVQPMPNVTRDSDAVIRASEALEASGLARVTLQNLLGELQVPN